MIEAGMNVARLNFSHGTHANHLELIKTIRRAARKTKTSVAIMADLQGPKVRVGVLPGEGIELSVGKPNVFLAGATQMKDLAIPIPYAGLAKDLSRGDRILLDDGLLEVEVVSIRGREIHTKVIVGGVLTSHKGFNVPTATLGMPTFTKKDLDDLRFAIDAGVDFVALSFVRTAADIVRVRRLLAKSPKGRSIQLIAKIEKHEAIKNFDAIFTVVDGIMVARGDLGIETDAEHVPILQKQIIEKCLHGAKPVIVATQMLDSMIRNPRPTRAEVSDVANAVMDHADAVMLSGESASGKYPLEAVRMMAKVITETEKSPYDDLVIDRVRDCYHDAGEALGEVATVISCGADVKVIAVTTMGGLSARYVSRFRPSIPVIAFTNTEIVGHQLLLSWGIKPVVLPRAKTLDGLFSIIQKYVMRERLAKRGEKIVIVTGDPVGKKGTTNLVKIVTL